MLGKKRGASLFSSEKSNMNAVPTDQEAPLGMELPPEANTIQMTVLEETREPKIPENLTQYSSCDGTILPAMQEPPKHTLTMEVTTGHRAQALFFTPENDGRDFTSVLADVQEYISSKYSTLITNGDGDAKEQIKRYILKYVQDHRIAVQGLSGEKLADALYTEMAEFGFLTKYIFGTGIEEINGATRS